MLWAMGDLHLDSSGKKPMDVFGENWQNHEEKIFTDWQEKVKEDDIVLLVGDISWALKLEECVEDLKRIDSLPGKKYMIKGNHDYWWSSMAKLEALDLKTIFFIHNNAYIINGVGICGTRGWSDIDSNSFDEQDERIYKRELLRLELSIEELDKKSQNQKIEKRIALIHYPPFSSKGEPNDFAKVLSDNGMDECYYGHLHAHGHKFVVEGNFDGVDYRCVSSDYIDFKLYAIE